MLLFTDSTKTLQADPAAFVTANRASIWSAWILGGTKSVTTPAETQLRGLLQ